MGGTGLGTILGTRIRARREAMGWSQAKLAEAVELTPNYLGSLERGEALPTVQTLVVLAKALNTSPADLLGSVSAPEEWLDRLITIARTLSPAQQPLLVALAETMATYEPVAPLKKRPTRRRAKRRRP
jgi:transcriptional regulator with XRE-family HTH domain